MEHKHFLIVGAQRSGTTYLYHLLSDHPEILMSTPLRPEPKFFLLENAVELGLGAYHRSFFPRHGEFKILGEKSTSYLESPDAAERIKHCLPEAKIVVLLRDPIKRAVSHYWFTKEHGLEKRGLEEALERLEDLEPGAEAARCSVSPFRYLGRGLYLHDLENYEHLFGKEKMMVLILENFTGSREGLAALYRFVGATPDFRPKSWGQKFNDAAEGGGSALSERLRRRLAEYYRKTNDLLAGRYSLDLSAWG